MAGRVAMDGSDRKDGDGRLERQIAFAVEVDKLKHIFRQTLLMDASRRENDAEHSWHLALMAVLFREYARDQVDLLTVVKMALVHDLVEIDAGDTFCYDEKGYEDKAQREQQAADRIFKLLPEDLAGQVRGLWDEFEAGETPEARFANALDRFQPLLHNYRTQGAAWRRHSVTSDRVIARNRHIEDGAPELWRYARAMIDDAVRKGYLAPPERSGQGYA